MSPFLLPAPCRADCLISNVVWLLSPASSRSVTGQDGPCVLALTVPLVPLSINQLVTMIPHNTVPQTQHLQQQTRIFVTLSSWGWLLLAPGWLAKPQAVRWGAVSSPHLSIPSCRLRRQQKSGILIPQQIWEQKRVSNTIHVRALSHPTCSHAVV